MSRNAGGGGFGGGAELNKSRNENNNESLVSSFNSRVLFEKTYFEDDLSE